MAGKFYAVRVPAPPAIYTDWDSCQKAVHGKAGAQFRGFATRAEAETWAGIPSSAVASPSTKELRVYVDGSFKPSSSFAGWGWVAVKDGKEIARASGVTDGPAESRNIDGECLAAVEALRWLSSQGLHGVICHDYEGLARWALRQWKANSNIAKWYQESAIPLLGKNRFEKVTAHSGDPWNDLVDQLAKRALE